MAGLCFDLGFFWDTQIQIDIRVDISISVRPMTIEFGTQVHVDESIDLRVISQILMMSSL